MTEVAEMNVPTQAPVQPPANAEASKQMMQFLFGKHIMYSLSSLARLGVADHMGTEPVSAEKLAEAVGAKAPLLYRVMRMLASVGVFEEKPGQQFTLTPLGELLKTDTPGSFRHLAVMWGDRWSSTAFGYLTDCIRTGTDGVTAAYGKHLFDLLAEDPEQAQSFHQAMTSFSAVTGAAILEAYNFTGVGCLADVGGGHGFLLSSVLNKHPEISGVLFDLPEVVEGVEAASHFEGCRDRIKVAAGSFLERVPSGCDAYMLKHIVHDWDDERAGQVLRLIREQMAEGGRVLVCEMVVPDGTGPDPSKILDIEMLALTPGGKERTVSEFEELFRSAGFKLNRIVLTQSPICVLEAFAA